MIVNSFVLSDKRDSMPFCCKKKEENSGSRVNREIINSNGLVASDASGVCKRPKENENEMYRGRYR